MLIVDFGEFVFRVRLGEGIECEDSGLHIPYTMAL